MQRLLAVHVVGRKEQHLLVVTAVDAHVLAVWPIGQFIGCERMPSTFSISSMRSIGSLPWWVELVDEREDGDAALLADLEELLRLRL